MRMVGNMTEPQKTMGTENMSASRQSDREQEIAQIREALAGLRFGEVSIIVQDGVIVQIVRTEKRRLRIPKGTSGPG